MQQLLDRSFPPSKAFFRLFSFPLKLALTKIDGGLKLLTPSLNEKNQEMKDVKDGGNGRQRRNQIAPELKRRRRFCMESLEPS